MSQNGTHDDSEEDEEITDEEGSEYETETDEESAEVEEINSRPSAAVRTGWHWRYSLLDIFYCKNHVPPPIFFFTWKSHLFSIIWFFYSNDFFYF